MYLLYCLFLLLFVYLLPVLSIAPRMICTPSFAVSIPIVNAFILYLATTLMQQFGVFTNGVVLSFALGMGLIAMYRVRQVCLTQDFGEWKKQDSFLFLFNLLILLPFLAKLGTHGFDRGDEIYSWNFWAIQHYFSESLDFSHTGATYPQLFPKLLAFCYHFLGSLNLQLPIKAMLIVFPFCTLNMIACQIKQLGSKTTTHRLLYRLFYCLFILFGLFVVGLAKFFKDAYADPIMTAALVVSIGLYLQAKRDLVDAREWGEDKVQRKERAKTSLILRKNSFSNVTLMSLCLSAICGIMAMLTKQPGLIWVVFSLPILLLLIAWKKDLSVKTCLGLIGLCVGSALIWLLWEGHGFYANRGVIGASLQGRLWWQQFGFALNTYFIQKPSFLLLFGLVVLSFKRCAFIRPLVLFFWLPSLLMWLFFGAYHLRLGQHIVAVALLVVVTAFSDFPVFFKSFFRVPFSFPFLSKGSLSESFIQDKSKGLSRRFGKGVIPYQRIMVWSGVSLSLLVTGLIFYKSHLEKPGVSLYAGGRQSLQRYFGLDADKIYQEIYQNPTLTLWVPTRYLYGIFYHHTNLVSPGYQDYHPYDHKALMHELLTKQPDYVFTVATAVQDGPASSLLAQMIQACPMAFEKFASAPNRFDYVTYKINKQLIQDDPCLIALREKS